MNAITPASWGPLTRNIAGRRGILALDLAGKTGWAFGVPGEPPIGGVWKLPVHAVCPGRCYSALADLVADMLSEHRPAMVVHARGFRQAKNGKAADMATNLAGHVASTCFRHEVHVVAVHEATARKGVLGVGASLGGREAVKARVMAWATAEGLEPVGDDHADALLMLRYACGVAL
ncbi:MAG: hypothetical protein ACRYHQ_32325 [Janthinobacterium lividum]